MLNPNSHWITTPSTSAQRLLAGLPTYRGSTIRERKLNPTFSAGHQFLACREAGENQSRQPQFKSFFSPATTALLCRSSRVGAFHTRPAYTSREGNVVQHRAGAAANQSTPPAMVFPNDWEGFSPAIMGRVMDCEFCFPIPRSHSLCMVG